MIRFSPLQPEILFHAGPVPISRAVVTTWALMAALTLVSWWALRRTKMQPGPLQAAMEVIVATMSRQIGDILKRDASPYLPLLGTLFLFILCGNLAAAVPGLRPPTARLETTAALAGVVFFSVQFFGIRTHGFRGYLAQYLRPNPLLLPLNILEQITRVFSLMVRLFGNIMSHELVIAIIVFLAGLFVPVPFMLLGIMIGIIQAYIFTILAAVFIGAALGNETAKKEATR
jgi:F-type H+-transporting ATPase subunit a